jgi:predicted nucleotide-binding protein
VIDKLRALNILDEIFSRSGCLYGSERGPDYAKWCADFEAAVRHIFPGEKVHRERVHSILNPPQVYRAGSGQEPADEAAQMMMQRMLAVQAVLTSMMDEIRNYWEDSKSPSAAGGGEQGVAGVALDRRNIFVVHGRDRLARSAMFEFLRALKLNPLEWSEIVRATGKASPYVGEVLAKGFQMAQAVVVLLTPDDEVRLRERFRKQDDPSFESELSGQARPNVLFEAGMALGLQPDRTVLVELGALRPFSDVLGRHAIRMEDSSQYRHDLADRLQGAGCAVDLNGRDWHTAGKFGECLAAATAPCEAVDSVRIGFEGGLYWEIGPEGKAGSPFCPVCYERDGKLLHLQDGDSCGGGHKWFCLGCENGFGGGGMMSSWSD